MDMCNEARLAAAAAALRLARTGHRPADLPDGTIPAHAQDAYRVQDLVIGDEEVAGWKILATAAPGMFSCAALSRRRRLADAGHLLRGDRLPEVEVEIAIRIAADLPPTGTPWGEAAVAAALGTAHAAFEIIESRFAARKQADPLSVLADAQSCRAFAVGAGISDWQGLDLPALPISLCADGQELAAGAGGATAAQIVTALTWLANHASARGRGLMAGQFVITGARIGPLPIPPAGQISARMAGIGEVSLTLGV